VKLKVKSEVKCHEMTTNEHKNEIGIQIEMKIETKIKN